VRGAERTAFARPEGAGVRPVSSQVGFLLLDSAHKPIRFNLEAIRILTFSVRPGSPRPLKVILAKRARSIIGRCRRSPRSDSFKEFVSGRRRYLCRVIDLPWPPGSPSQHPVALLLERKAPRRGDVSRVARRYNLTPREQKTVELLMKGLTSKEIASRMQVSPNTVNSHIRVVMIRMGVSTRLGITGKLFEHATRMTA